jgi:spore coat polysaccharide biosynthesis protein SpsF
MEVGLLGNKDCVILIQARLNSTRLPGKILFKFFDDTVIERVIKIAKKVTDSKNIFIVSGSKKKNQILANLSIKNKIKVFFGNEKNVFLRFKSFLKSSSAKKYKYVYRITSDNYLIQPTIIKRMIKDSLKKKIDYAFVSPLSHYAGEVISKKLFIKNMKVTKMAEEHVTWDFRASNKINILKYPKNFFSLNHSKSITLDTINDLILLKKIELKFKGLKKLNNYKYFKRIEKNLLKLKQNKLKI